MRTKIDGRTVPSAAAGQNRGKKLSQISVGLLCNKLHADARWLPLLRSIGQQCDFYRDRNIGRHTNINCDGSAHGVDGPALNRERRLRLRRRPLIRTDR